MSPIVDGRVQNCCVRVHALVRVLQMPSSCCSVHALLAVAQTAEGSGRIHDIINVFSVCAMYIQWREKGCGGPCVASSNVWNVAACEMIDDEGYGLARVVQHRSPTNIQKSLARWEHSGGGRDASGVVIFVAWRFANDLCTRKYWLCPPDYV